MCFNITHQAYILQKTVTRHMKCFQEKAKMRNVIDGANAPKMTGKSRYKSLKPYHLHGTKDPASISDVYFGLSLLQ